MLVQALQIGAVLYGLGWIVFGCQAILTLPPDEVRKHPLAVFLTAVICGLLWPILVFKDVTGKTHR